MELKRHEWMAEGERHVSPFFVWVDGKPRFDLSDCAMCGHYRGEEPCAMAVEVGDDGDDKLYPFCGRVCGYFYLPPSAEDDGVKERVRRKRRGENYGSRTDACEI